MPQSYHMSRRAVWDPLELSRTLRTPEIAEKVVENSPKIAKYGLKLFKTVDTDSASSPQDTSA